jgi:TonB family protein
MKPLLFISALLMTISLASAQTTSLSPAVVAKSKGKALAIVSPAPRYPVDAQGRRPKGRGIVVMEVDTETGWVISAKMQTSTGNRLLDDAAIQAFSRWRFRPGTARHVYSPIIFGDQGRPRYHR